MRAKRREISTNSLSFLDILSCGLGAAVLLFLLIKHEAVTIPLELSPASSETDRLQIEIQDAQKYLAALLNSLQEVSDETASSREVNARIEAELKALEAELAALKQGPEEAIASLEAQIESIKKEIAIVKADQQTGSRAREFLGQGDRQYLTGLNLGGRHILILIDQSASMLDETIVNVIRRRSRDEATRIDSPKWQRAIRIVDWLTASLPTESQVQVLGFNTAVFPLINDQVNAWFPVSSHTQIDQGIAKLRKTAPSGGTSLINVMEAVSRMSPLPDNIFLITDGLPTQGATAPNSSTVTGAERMQLFNQAIAKLPRNIPVNTLLLPMEGDPVAAAAFWKLAIDTQGSFIAPARDWP